MKQTALLLLIGLYLPAVEAHGTAVAGPAASRATDYVIIVSVDGFANHLLWNKAAPMPFLRARLPQAAVARDGQVCSFPTVTWPNHTTLVTGVSPARHGVLANNVYDRMQKKRLQLIIDPLFDKDELVRVPTLYDVAHRAGLKTAALAWPATRRASTLDWTVPDMHVRDGFARYATPGLLERLRRAGLPVDRYGPWLSDPTGGAKRDWLWIEAAIKLYRTERPNLMLIHFVEMDHVLHRYGPGSGDDLWVATYTDYCLRRLWEGARAALGPEARVTMIISSDHGFFAVHRTINLGVFFKQTYRDRLRPVIVPQGGSAAIYLPNSDPDVRSKVARELARVEGVQAVFEPEQFDQLGQPRPDENPWAPDLWVAAEEGYSFSANSSAKAVVTTGSRRGTHGFLPDQDRMRGVFIMFGAGVAKGVNLGKVDNRQVAPTAAALLGLSLEHAELPPLNQALRAVPAR